MSDKSDLLRLNQELGDVWEKILAIIHKDQNGSIMVYYEGDNKFAESASSLCEQFDGRIGYARRQLSKIAQQVGIIERSEKRKEKDMKEKAKETRKKRKKIV